MVLGDPTVQPLDGVTILEFGGIGPGPFAGFILAGMGAEVHRIERPGATDPPRSSALLRSRRMHALDLKNPADRDVALQLVRRADALYETARPGVMERLGLSPEVCAELNPKLVYARMTGWGQSGPYRSMPGHDINYLAISGVLNTIGEAGQGPVAPVNYVGDYGAGGMMLVAAITSGLLRCARSGRGSIIDVAMVDGAAMMLTDLLSRIHAGQWNRARGTNTFDGGAPFYRTYETSDGRFMAVGAIEPQFYGELLRGLDVQDLAAARQYDPEAWPETTKRFASAFRSQSQAYWTSVFAQLEACVSPVLGWDQLTSDPHLEARQLFTPTAGGIVPSSAPRFTDLIDGTHRALPGGPWDAV